MPSLGMMTINALVASDAVLIPVQAAYLPVKGLQQLIKTISMVKKRLNRKLQIMGILLTMVDFRTNYAKDISTLIAKDLRTVDSLEFDDPEKLVSSASRIAETQLKLSQARMKAVKALDKAKQQLKDELSKEIQSDPELLSKLCSIIDKTEIK